MTFVNLQPVTGVRHKCCFFPLAIVFKPWLKLVSKATLKASMEQFCKSTTLLIAQVASSWTPPAWNAAYEYQSQSIPTIWVPSLCITWPQYRTRLCKAMQAMVYHITPWQYPSRLASTDMESEGRGGGILRANFANFSFQKYLRAASGFYDSRNVRQNLISRASAESRRPESLAGPPLLTRKGLSHSDSQLLPVTRRSPSHAPRPTFTQVDLPRPESLAAARVIFHNWLAEARVTRRWPSHSPRPSAGVTRSGPLSDRHSGPAARVQAFCAARVTRTVRAQVTRQVSRHSQRAASLALTGPTRSGLPSLDEARVTRRGPPSFGPSNSPRPAFIQDELPRPKSLAASRVNHSWSNSYINLYKNLYIWIRCISIHT